MNVSPVASPYTKPSLLGILLGMIFVAWATILLWPIAMIYPRKASDLGFALRDLVTIMIGNKEQ